jgi:hypothetical protein
MVLLLSKLKYPKFLLLIFTFILAYFLFKGRTLDSVRLMLESLGYFGAFIAGVMYSYGFTAGPSTAIFLILAKQQNIVICGLLGGLGALVGDLIIFKFIRSGFTDELKMLSEERIVKTIRQKLPHSLRIVLLPLLASLIIASPLPDEIGVMMFAAATKIHEGLFSVLSYVLNTAGIFIILAIGASI